MATAFGASELLTTLVPRALVRIPGAVTISVRDVFDAARRSPSATLTVEG